MKGRAEVEEEMVCWPFLHMNKEGCITYRHISGYARETGNSIKGRAEVKVVVC